MYRHHAAFFEFHERIKSLAEMSEAQAVMTLKFELFHALERANDALQRANECQNRAEALEIERNELQDELRARCREHQAYSAELHRLLTRRTEELAEARAQSQQLRAMRLDILSMETRCQTLDEICRSLLLTIEHAATETDLAQTAPAEPSRVSAASA